VSIQKWLMEAQIGSRSRRAKNLTDRMAVPAIAGIWVIFRGVNFSRNTDIGPIGHLWMGTIYYHRTNKMSSYVYSDNLWAPPLAYFATGKNIGKIPVLTALASSVGLHPEPNPRYGEPLDFTPAHGYNKKP
jgi:hypothetical protein